MNYKAAFKKQLRFLLTAGLLISLNTMATADKYDIEKVSMCVACHGADGIGKANHYPSLQGKPVAYIVSQLQYFKSGSRKSSDMNVVAKSLSEEDMQMLAEFFNQVK
jgi:cytochrome c553